MQVHFYRSKNSERVKQSPFVIMLNRGCSAPDQYTHILFFIQGITALSGQNLEV